MEFISIFQSIRTDLKNQLNAVTILCDHAVAVAVDDDVDPYTYDIPYKPASCFE